MIPIYIGAPNEEEYGLATVTIRLSGSKDLDALIEWLTDYDGVSEVSTAEESD